jgi:Zn-dependent metalloprotease
MNKKKRRGNSKIFSTITLVFVLCCFMATSSWAARKFEFYQAKARDYIKLLNQNKDREGPAIAKTLGLGRDEAFTLLGKRTDFNGVTHYRYQQTYKGIPVWGVQTNIGIGPGGNVVRLHGTMVLDTPGDIKNIPSSLDPQVALKRMVEQHKKKDKGAQWNFRNEKYGTYIYLDEQDRAHLCHVVSFFADTEKGNPSQFIHFIDVKKGKVINSFDMLRHQGVGPGGNMKVGYYYYGVDYPPFCVTESGGTCFMDCTYVKTCNWEGTCPHSFPCYENTYKEVNGAYCPMNDAQYFGQAICDMYIGWYGVPPLPFQIVLVCHYSTNYSGYFWDGSGLYLGDGDNKFYPSVALDLIAHEVSHGFTDFHSDLIYSGQSGGINESFSDMAGEAAKYYVRGTNDFRFCYDIVKDPDDAVRYLYDPPLDGHSIDHVDDYYAGMDVHYSSGIFNKAFYLIATSPNWNTRMAFDIFAKANMDYWTPSTNFQQGAEGAVMAASDYGYSCQDVANAFAEVGISIICCLPPIADFACSPTMGAVPLTVSFTDKSIGALSLLWDFGDGGTSIQQNPVNTYTEIGLYSPALTVSNACGSDTTVKTDYIKVYCASSGITQDYEYISGVRVADLDNSSGPSPYSNFTNLTAHLTRGRTFNVSLAPAFPGGSYTEYWKIWIDYNGNCVFEDEEEVFRGFGSSIVNGSFTVPGNTVIDDTLMRVSMKYGSYATPCETFPYGEVEDYTVNIACFGPGVITNPGFEIGTTSGWVETGVVSITSDSHTGSYAVSVDGANSSVEQEVFDLCPNSSYTVSCWGKARKTANVFLGVKDYGGAEQTVQFTDYKNFVKKSITVTTGPTNTIVTIFFIKLAAKFSGTADDFEIVKN